MTEVAEEFNEFEVERESDADAGEHIRRLRDVRDQIADLKKIEAEERKWVPQSFDERGTDRIYDETSNLGAVLKKETRWEWDENLLLASGELSPEDVGKVLISSVSKPLMADLILSGTARARMVESCKKPTKIIEKIDIKERSDLARRLI